MLGDFFSSTMGASRIGLVGVGIDTMQLTKMASTLDLPSGKGATEAKVQFALPCWCVSPLCPERVRSLQAQYFGGEERLDLGGGATSVILAAEVSPKEALAARLLVTAMGKGIFS